MYFDNHIHRAKNLSSDQLVLALGVQSAVVKCVACFSLPVCGFYFDFVKEINPEDI
jgi:hypothetical protein